jgi:hypothetical protein
MIGAIVGLATVIVVLVVLAFIESHSETKLPCMLQEDRDTVLRLSLSGVDKGFQQHVASLFIIWVQDPKTQQPARAQKGIQNGIDAYVRARADAKAWLPVIC